MQVLRAIDADVINVVEVENCQVLHALTVLLGRQYYRYYMVPGSDSATGQNVGLVTKIDPIQNLQRSEDRVRWPIEQSACGYHGRHRESGATKHYHTRLRVNNATLNIVGLHFKAGVNHAPSCAQREAQAEVIRALIQRTSRIHAICEDGSSTAVSAGTIVLGDFNDLDGDVVSAVSREKPRSTVLQLLQQLQPDTTDDDLHNVAQLLPKDERYSFHGEVHGRSLRSLIDHVLVSQDLLPLVQSVRIFRDAPGLGSHNKRDRISDHYPYIVDLAANQLRADSTHCAAATRTGTNRSMLRDEV